MVNMAEKHQMVIKKWKKYINENQHMPEKDSDIRDFIFESWKRSKAHNVNPSEIKKQVLPEAEFKKLLDRNQNLINVAHSYMQNIYSFIKGTNFVLTLTDADGYVLDIISDDSDALIHSKSKQSNLTLGCCRNEKYAGTNGIGTCLVLERPIQIFAYEHYSRQFHGLIGTAAPIRNSQNVIIGCLDVLGPVGLPHNHTLAMVSATADAIQKELSMMETYNHVALLNKQLTATLQTIDSGIIMFNNLGIITQYNNRACQILHFKEGRLDNENIANIFNLSKSNFNPFEAKTNIQNQEVSIMTYRAERIPLSLSLSIMKNDLGQQVGTLLVINELKKTFSLVNRMSGFNATYTFDSIIGNSPEIQAAKNMGITASQSSSNVLILGESGTGKELMAQAIHNASSRADKPFIAINCASLPRGLIESELFGYARGAFTGAKKEGQPGKFELANGGTIFLDEIGDMPIELQTSLLRVLQTKEVIRIGGTQVHSVDVRIIAATNVDLLNSVNQKNFREDLYYRINVLPIKIPSLRQRKTDIDLLLTHFMESTSRTLDKDITTISKEAKQALTDYDWPGNVRELENTIERAVNLASGSVITLNELPSEIVHSGYRRNFASDDSMSVNTTVDISSEINSKNRSRQLLIDALAAEHGNVSKAAELLGIPRRTLYRRIDKFNIDVNEFRLL